MHQSMKLDKAAEYHPYSGRSSCWKQGKNTLAYTPALRVKNALISFGSGNDSQGIRTNTIWKPGKCACAVNLDENHSSELLVLREADIILVAKNLLTRTVVPSAPTEMKNALKDVKSCFRSRRLLRFSPVKHLLFHWSYKNTSKLSTSNSGFFGRYLRAGVCHTPLPCVSLYGEWGLPFLGIKSTPFFKPWSSN